MGAVVGLSLVLRRGFRLVVNVFRIRIQEDFGSFLREIEKGVFNVGFIGAIHGFSWGYRWFVACFASGFSVGCQRLSHKNSRSFGSFFRDFEKGVFYEGASGRFSAFHVDCRWFVMGLFGY